MNTQVVCKVDSLDGNEIIQFLEEHLDDMRATSPPESIHALDLEGLKHPNITFWSFWNEQQLVGCGALKTLSNEHGEIKSMRVAKDWRGQGIASTILHHILQQAQQKGLQQISLETGSMAFFAPARRLYQRHGFSPCPPFGDYQEDPNSVFMTKALI